MTGSGTVPLAPGDHDLPPELQRSMERHQQHLASLVASMRAAGLDEAMIDASVAQLMDSHRIELTRALHSLNAEQSHD